jgi:hypothetical protein
LAQTKWLIVYNGLVDPKPATWRTLKWVWQESEKEKENLSELPPSEPRVKIA